MRGVALEQALEDGEPLLGPSGAQVDLRERDVGAFELGRLLDEPLQEAHRVVWVPTRHQYQGEIVGGLTVVRTACERVAEVGLGAIEVAGASEQELAQERLEQRPDGLVRISLKKAYTDGTVAVDMDPLSLLCRLATSVPPPRLHTVRYAGVLAAASPLRPKIAPKPRTEEPAAASAEPDRTGPAGGYRPWAELLARTFAVDVLACPKCHGRMRLLALVQEPANVARFLAAMGEATEMPRRSPGRGPPYWKSHVLRRQALGDEDDGQGRWVPQTA